MFSVIIPAYNCEKTIYDTLESVITQTRVDLIDEVIVVNDGSIDNTCTIIEDYIKEHNDIKIRLMNQSNLGVSAARNNGIRQATGDWIALLDSDDIWLSNKLECQKRVIDAIDGIYFLGSAYPLKICFNKYYSGVYKITPGQLCLRSIPSTPSVVFNREKGIELGLFNENMKYCEDINFFQKFLCMDSYYIIADDLIKISNGKRYFAESGLSSNLYEMHKGRNRNTIALFDMKLISRKYLVIMLIFNQIKYFRRLIISALTRILHYKVRKEKNMFSVIVPAYNCEKTIIMSLESVKKQTRLDLIEEIIIINDGSTDNTKIIIENYISDNPDLNIILINQENHGVSYSRNIGIKHAKAPWIALLDSDDVWRINKIERQSEILCGGGEIAFLGAVSPLKFLIIKHKGLVKINAKQLCIRNLPQTSSVVFRKDIGIELGLFDVCRCYCEDIQFYQKFLLIDSYYILAEQLTDIEIGKQYFGENGLTSNLLMMHKGRNQNTRELYNMGLISWWFMMTMLVFNQFKYYRRCIIRNYHAQILKKNNFI